MQLTDKAALVSGASHGIGKAIALALADAGADVALTYRTREDGARETARLIEAKGRRALVLKADVTEAEACREIVERTVEAFGQIDMLVNNAGGSRAGPLTELSLEDWRYTFDLCVTAAFLTAQTRRASHDSPRKRVDHQHLLGAFVPRLAVQHRPTAWPRRR